MNKNHTIYPLLIENIVNHKKKFNEFHLQDKLLIFVCKIKNKEEINPIAVKFS